MNPHSKDAEDLDASPKGKKNISKSAMAVPILVDAAGFPS